MKTTKISKSKVMKAAWNYVRENNWTISAALKVSWKEAKEGKNNDIDALSSLVGSPFYTAYLMNGNIITMFQYQNDFFLFDNKMSYMHTNMKLGGKYDKEAERKGYKNQVELFKAEGLKIKFAS